MSAPAHRGGRTPSRRPPPSAVPVRGRRPAPEPPPPHVPSAPPPPPAGRFTVSHTTGAIRLRSSRTGVPRTGSPRARVRSDQPRVPRSTPVRPELRLLPMTGPVPVARAPRRAPGRSRSPRAPFVILVVGLLVGTTIGVLVLNTAIAVDSLKATSLRVANAQRSEEVQRLQQQVVQADAPGRLAARAGQAGLVPAGTPGYLVIRPDGTSVLRGTPSAAPTPPPAPPSSSGAPAQPAPTTSPAAPAPAGLSVAGD